MKKSEFYAAMCICIILCSLQTVFAVSYQTQIIQPTKPYIAAISQSAADGTYYTVLDAAGSGICGEIFVTGATNANGATEIRATVDGIAYTLDIGGNYASAGQTTSSGGLINSVATLYYNSPIYFRTSLKVEFVQKNGAPIDINACVKYSLQ